MSPFCQFLLPFTGYFGRFRLLLFVPLHLFIISCEAMWLKCYGRLQTILPFFTLKSESKLLWTYVSRTTFKSVKFPTATHEWSNWFVMILSSPWKVSPSYCGPMFSRMTFKSVKFVTCAVVPTATHEWSIVEPYWPWLSHYVLLALPRTTVLTFVL
jgi:hypothetical protein